MVYIIMGIAKGERDHLVTGKEGKKTPWAEMDWVFLIECHEGGRNI